MAFDAVEMKVMFLAHVETCLDNTTNYSIAIVVRETIVCVAVKTLSSEVIQRYRDFLIDL